MSLLIRSVLGRRSCSVLRRPGLRSFCAAAEEANTEEYAKQQSVVNATEEYAKRNYAENVAEYNTVFAALNSQRRTYLLKHAYDDMMLDGVQPTRDTFFTLILGTTKGGFLQDSFFFRDEMKAMGLVPDVEVYNFLISNCGRAKLANQAMNVFEEMKINGVKPNAQTCVCLLNACAAAGQLDHVYAIIRDLTAMSTGLNKFCYAGLISAHVNKKPVSDAAASKIVELVQQSKGWSSVESSPYLPNNLMTAISDEELYNLPTAPFVYRRGFLNRQLTVYHVAFYACAEIGNVKVMETLSEMLNDDGVVPDPFILMQTMRCYLLAGDLDRGLKIFDDYIESGKVPIMELYVALAEGAMIGYTPRGMQIALDTLVKMNSRNFFLSAKMATDLLLEAAKTKVDGYKAANYIWDLAQTRKLNIAFPAVEAYFNGLKEFEIPEDDPRLLQVSRTYKSLRFRPRAGPGQRQSERQKKLDDNPGQPLAV